MRYRVLAVALCAVALLPGQGTTAPSESLPSATLLVAARSQGHEWIETARLDGTRRTPVTRPVARYEMRDDSWASFAPDGTKVLFRRESKRDRVSVMIAGSDGTGIRRVLTLAQARRIEPRTTFLGVPIFTPDAGAAIVAAYNGCSTERVLRVPLEGGRPLVVWRRPRGQLMSVDPVAFLADGTLVAVASRNDGDCYYGHTGPDRLLLLEPGGPARALGPASNGVGKVVVMPDGETVVWAADCASLCQVWSTKVGGVAHPLTRFRSRTAPLSGYDRIPLVAVGEDAVAYGRGRSAYLRSLAGAAGVRRVARFGCPRKRGCSLSEIDYLSVSPEGQWMVVGVTDHGCELCEGNPPATISERFAIRPDGTGVTTLPLVAFWDIRFD